MSAPYNRKDKLYERAKDEGYRSRAAYKLIELNERFKLIRPGTTVLDLGSWPGGWLQVAAPMVGANGLVVGIDLVAIDPLPDSNVTFITGDARDDANIEKLRELSPGGYGVVISDMSPKLTGIKEADQAGTVGCAELALFIAGKVLKRGGALIIKVFKGNETELFVKNQLRLAFEKIHRCELDATRRTSNEYYLVGLGFKAEIKP